MAYKLEIVELFAIMDVILRLELEMFVILTSCDVNVFVIILDVVKFVKTRLVDVAFVDTMLSVFMLDVLIFDVEIFEDNKLEIVEFENEPFVVVSVLTTSDVNPDKDAVEMFVTERCVDVKLVVFILDDCNEEVVILVVSKLLVV